MQNTAVSGLLKQAGMRNFLAHALQPLQKAVDTMGHSSRSAYNGARNFLNMPKTLSGLDAQVAGLSGKVDELRFRPVPQPVSSTQVSGLTLDELGRRIAIAEKAHSSSRLNQGNKLNGLSLLGQEILGGVRHVGKQVSSRGLQTANKLRGIKDSIFTLDDRIKFFMKGTATNRMRVGQKLKGIRTELDTVNPTVKREADRVVDAVRGGNTDVLGGLAGQSRKLDELGAAADTAASKTQQTILGEAARSRGQVSDLHGQTLSRLDALATQAGASRSAIQKQIQQLSEATGKSAEEIIAALSGTAKQVSSTSALQRSLSRRLAKAGELRNQRRHRQLLGGIGAAGTAATAAPFANSWWQNRNQ